MSKSIIEWTDQSWNPIIGCSHSSPGCDNCYAEKIACRLANMDATDHYAEVLLEPEPTRFTGWNGKTAFVKCALDKPLCRKKPTIYFVCSMSDLFHFSVKTQWIDQVLEVISVCPQHTFLVLTKRPWNIDPILYSYFPGNPARELGEGDYLPNLWLGATVCNQAEADKKIPALLKNTRHAGFFVSIEPMLGPIDISEYMPPDYMRSRSAAWEGGWRRPGLDQVILGGESGPCARPMHPDWVRSLRDQCAQADVPFDLKQWGEWHPLHGTDSPRGHGKKKQRPFCWVHPDGHTTDSGGDPAAAMIRTGKKQSGRLLDGQLHDQLIWRQTK